MENTKTIDIKLQNYKIPIFLDSVDPILANYDHFIFDCDGVVWREKTIIPECVEFIRSLIKINKKVYFLSNTNRLSRKDLQNKIEKLCNLDIPLENIYNSSYLISKFIQTNHKEIKNVYLIGEEGLEKELEAHGLNIFGGPTNKNMELNEKIINNFSHEKVHDIKVDPRIDACVCGFDQYFNYFKLVYGTFVINKTGVFFGTNYDRHIRVGDRLAPGTYSFISSLETSTGKNAVIVSKPDPQNLKIIAKDHNIESNDRILMVGDNLNTDIEFAINSGIDSILVLTGITSEDTLNKYELKNGNVPTYVIKHF